MTALSTTVLPTTSDRDGPKPATICLATDFRVPEKIVSALNLWSSCLNESRALSAAKRDGLLDAIPVMADKAAAALAPVEKEALVDRLTLLGMSMANGRDKDQVMAWLHETARLLSDLPQSVLFDAIDECVKEPERVFAPSVGEIRAKTVPALSKLELHAANLRKLANAIADGAEIPDWVEPERPWLSGVAEFQEEDRCSPEDAASILAEFGLKRDAGDKLAAMLTPKPVRSRADYIAAGEVPPPLDLGAHKPLTV